MANTLTNLIPDIYAALDVVSREQVGMIPSVMMDAQVNRVAVGQTLRVPVAPASSAADITPAVTPPDAGDQTISNVTVTISKARRVIVRWNGEEEAGMESGVGFRLLLQNQFAQAMRTLCNEIEADLTGLYNKASRACGTAGTAPFGTAGDFSDAANVRKILIDNGAPVSDLRLVVDTAAGASIRGKQASVAVQGGDTLLRQGVLQEMGGMMIRESGQIKTHTKGTGASATTSNAGFALGATTLALASAGTGTIVAGDVITLATENANIPYVVTTGDTDVSNGGSIVIGAPGLLKAITTATRAITIGANYTANLCFAQSAILLAVRPPMIPTDGDAATDSMIVTDPRSGLSFEVRLYPQYRQLSYEIGIAWGVQVIKPEHLAILMG